MILCADDYGLRADINRAILELCAGHRLSAVSCMAAIEACTPGLLADLRAFENTIDIGLHLCLTAEEGVTWEREVRGALSQPLTSLTGCEAGSRGQVGFSSAVSFPTFSRLLRGAWGGRISPEAIAAQVSAQYALFVRKCGRAPDYVDGHLHAHQLPGVREGLLKFVLSLPGNQRPYVRNTWLPMRALWRRRLPWVKSLLIGTFGTRLQRRLRAAGLATNEGFAGIYDFRRWRHYESYFPRFVACLSSRNGILVVHPGEEDDWRRQEAAVLRAFRFRPEALNRFRR